MTRLVTERAATLSEAQVGQLWDLIKTSREHDAPFFELCKHLRSLIKSGHTGELNRIQANERVVVNLAHAHIKTKLPSTFFREPTVEAAAPERRYETQEKTWAGVLNATISRIGLKKEAKAAVLDALVYPEGWLKAFRTAVPDDEGVLQGTSSKPRGDIVGPRSEAGAYNGPTVWLTKGSPAFARVSPLNVVVDYRSSDRSPETARFISFQYVKTLSELKADPRYKTELLRIPTEEALTNEGIVKDRSSSTVPELLDSGVPNGPPQDREVILHEVWVHQLVDLRLYKQVVYLIEGTDGLVTHKVARLENGRIPGWEAYMGRHFNTYPCARLVFNSVPDARPNSELGVWSSLHSAMNWLVSRSVSMVDNQRQVFTVRKGATADFEKTKAQFTSGGPRTLIEVTENDAIQAVPNHASTRDDSILMNLLLEMIRRVGGQSENRQGGDNFRTATAAASAARSDAIKADEEVDTVSDWLKTISEMLARMIRAMVEDDGHTEFVTRLNGDAGAVDWLNFTSEDINWMPELSITVNSFRKQTKEEDAQKVMLAFNAALQAAPLIPNVRMDVLLRQLFEALEIGDIGQILDNTQDSMMLQAVELALMLGGQEVNVEQDHDHAAHARVLDMFLNSEQAGEIANSNPEGLALLMTHRDQHQQALDQLSQSVSSSSLLRGENLFQAASVNPANQARSETASEREAVRPQQGAAGQF